MIKREKNTTYVATISGGKDSTVQADLLCKNGYPVDYILFYDTLEEHEEMYVYLEKLKKYFLDRYSKKITVLKPRKYKNFDDYVFSKITRGKNKNKTFGFLGNKGFCHWRTYSKIQVEDRFTKKFNNVIIYIGFTKNENRTLEETNKKKFIYPLKSFFGKDENDNIIVYDKNNKNHKLGLTEDDCKDYLINQDMENQLYRHFSRTGCAMCPFQSPKHWFNIYKYYPNKWNEIKQRENKLSNFKNVLNPLAFGDKSIFEIEKEFINADRQGSLFDFSDEPVRDCFCKI